MVTKSSARARIGVQLWQHASSKQLRELGAFTRYCVFRIERELGERESWAVHIEPAPGGYTSAIAVAHFGEVLEERGTGFDGALATWDAMCRIEQRLRERRRC
jgi:hypothetical protein